MQFKRRPWGIWLILWNAKHFKIKLIYFKKDGQLSMQKHKHRNELWCFLKGNGIIRTLTKNHKGSLFSQLIDEFKKGDFIIIEKEKWHQYEAYRRTWILEIQYGEKCKESDIERKYE